jgi:putative ABC transport system permease protein
VFYAAVAGTQDERLYQATVMRTLGARRGQLVRANLAEFALTGALAGLIGAGGASVLGYVLASRVLNVTYTWSPTAWLFGVVGGALGIALAGHLGTRRVLDVPPLAMMREIA